MIPLGFLKQPDSIILPSLISYWKPGSIEAAATTDGDTISTWSDSHDSNDGTQTGTLRPILNIASNGAREVEFDGTNDWLNVGQPSNLDFTAGTDTWTIVAKVGTVVLTTGYFISKRPASSTTAQFSLFLETATQLGGHSGMALSDYVTISAVAAGDLFIMTVSTTQQIYRHNGVEVGDNTDVGTATNSSDVNIGGRTNGSFLNDGSIAFVAIYDTVLTAQQITEIEQQYNP